MSNLQFRALSSGNLLLNSSRAYHENIYVPSCILFQSDLLCVFFSFCSFSCLVCVSSFSKSTNRNSMSSIYCNDEKLVGQQYKLLYISTLHLKEYSTSSSSLPLEDSLLFTDGNIQTSSPFFFFSSNMNFLFS